MGSQTTTLAPRDTHKQLLRKGNLAQLQQATTAPSLRRRVHSSLPLALTSADRKRARYFRFDASAIQRGPPERAAALGLLSDPKARHQAAAASSEQCTFSDGPLTSTPSAIQSRKTPSSALIVLVVAGVANRKRDRSLSRWLSPGGVIAFLLPLCSSLQAARP